MDREEPAAWARLPTSPSSGMGPRAVTRTLISSSVDSPSSSETVSTKPSMASSSSPVGAVKVAMAVLALTSDTR